jgi:hypothetical protein
MSDENKELKKWQIATTAMVNILANTLVRQIHVKKITSVDAEKLLDKTYSLLPSDQQLQRVRAALKLIKKELQKLNPPPKSPNVILFAEMRKKKKKK